MKRHLPFLIIGVVALLTIGAGILLYYSKRIPLPVVSGNWSASEIESDKLIHIRGRADAPITLEEFGDFQCPPCGTLADPINQLEQDYKPRLRIIFRQFPLAMHQHAREAALASEAAGVQGCFWEMHDLLYREQSVWSKAVDVEPLFNAYAGILRLNVDRFVKDRASDQLKARVESDYKRGSSLGVTTTPTIFINNRMLLPSALNPAGLRAAIDHAFEGKLKP